MSQKLILDAAEKLMLEEGYAAVSTRRVAKEAGLKAPLVHYYYPTTDDLFLAVFRRSTSKQLEKLDKAGSSDESLLNIWRSYKSSQVTSLAIEFMALANHRKSIKDEIAAFTERARQRRAEVLATLIDPKMLEPENCSTAGLAVLLVGVARTLVMERGLGISLGHEDANQFVESWLNKLRVDRDGGE